MTQYSLDPAFVQINYHSMYAPHKMIIPTLAWDDSIGTGGVGGYEAYDTSPRDGLEMITDFVTLLKVLHPTTTVFDDFVIFTKASPEAENLPVASAVLDIDGTGAGAAVPAAMQTWSFRSANFNPFKLVQLDLVCATNFLPTKVSALTADQLAVVQDLTSVSNAFAARDGSRISSLIQITAKLSDVLRKAYRLA